VADELKKKANPLFPDLSGDDDDGVTEMDSLCLRCYKEVQYHVM